MDLLQFLVDRKIVHTVIDGKISVGGSLYLAGCTGLTSLPDCLTVGGYLDLRNCTGLTSLPDGLTVGGYLDLAGCTGLTSLPDGLTVGGYLYLAGCTGVANKTINKIEPKEGFLEAAFNKNGYTFADNILAKIIHTKGNALKIRIVGKKEESWLVHDGKGNNAHGKTLREATLELSFKLSSKDVTQYKGMPLYTTKTPEEWSYIYRAITGACKQGTSHFMGAKELKESYTLAEIIEETKGAFGHDKFVETVKGE